ncbi:MAG TPA: SCO family protein [bacterium]|jgi:protein SCO1/2|nr:SCO family protein [bacterium]
MDNHSMGGRVRTLTMAGLGLALALVLWSAWRRPAPAPALLHYGPVPAFKLTGMDAKPFASSALAGKVWAASFVYTQCKNSCPMLQAQMRRLSQSLPAGPAFALVSITVDPDRDTPQALAAYAQKMGLTDPRWAFLTGPKPVLKKLIQEGFHLAAEPGERQSDARRAPDILHSSKIVLVDKHGDIRGYYDGLLAESVEAVRNDAARLAAED